MKSFAQHWSDIYFIFEDNAFDYSQVIRIGEDFALIDGEMFGRHLSRYGYYVWQEWEVE